MKRHEPYHHRRGRAAMFGRILLFVIGLAFAPYGLICLLDPLRVAEITGLQLHNASALAEVVAMYGGLQLGLGVFFLFCAVRSNLASVGLVLLAVVMGSLALGRVFGLMMYGGSEYNWAVLIFEGASSVLGVLALRSLTPVPEASDVG